MVRPIGPDHAICFQRITTMPEPTIASTEGRQSVTDSSQRPLPYDQNRAQLGCGPEEEKEEGPKDENFVDDDIIENNSHVITITRPRTAYKGQALQISQ